MDGVTHILSMMTAPWCGWTMLVLLLCAVFAETFQPGVISQTSSSLLARTDRTYKDSPNTFLGWFFITLFRIGTPAMALCLCFFSPDRASFIAFWAVCGLVLAVVLVKMLLNLLLDYTFSLSRRFGDAYEHYGNIVTMAALVLYPVLLVLMRVANTLVTQWVVGIMAVLFIGMWTYRAARTYTVSLSATLYMLFYIATLEVLPMAVLIYLSAKTIAII